MKQRKEETRKLRMVAWLKTSNRTGNRNNAGSLSKLDFAKLKVFLSVNLGKRPTRVVTSL